MPENILLTQAEVADQLRISPRTLESWRSKGYGPSTRRIGNRVMYRQTDIDNWIEDAKDPPVFTETEKPNPTKKRKRRTRRDMRETVQA